MKFNITYKRTTRLNSWVNSRIRNSESTNRT